MTALATMLAAHTASLAASQVSGVLFKYLPLINVLMILAVDGVGGSWTTLPIHRPVPIPFVCSGCHGHSVR